MADQSNHVLTLIGNDISADQLTQIQEFITNAGLTVSAQECLAQGATLFLSGADCHPASLQRELLTLGRQLGIDLTLQITAQQRTDYKLICFDMDSTLIQNETMDEIAVAAGIGEHISKITESVMCGQITFKESFNTRLALLEGFPASRLPEIAKKLTLSPGAKTAISTLRKRGVKIALFSGGFTYFAEGLQAELGPLDFIHANVLEIVDEKLTGKIIGDLVDEKKKAELIQSIAAELNIEMQQTIAVGDGANDIPMLKLAGMGVAYHAKPVVREMAQFVIDHNGLDAILPMLNWKN